MIHNRTRIIRHIQKAIEWDNVDHLSQDHGLLLIECLPSSHQ